MSKYLVSGGAGFLGSHLADALLAKGHEVVVVDNFVTGHIRNIAHLLKNSNFTLIEHDITRPLSIRVDGIFNFACPASPEHYQIDPVQTIKTNVHGSINMLDLARENDVRILQASTSEVYGDPEISPQHESYWGRVNPIGIRACYDEGKRAAETLFFDYHRQYGLDIRVIRIFNTYGPRMSPNDGRVVSNFCVQGIRKQPMTVYGKGLQTRSFCYVDDLIKGCIEIYESMNPSAVGPTNIGNSTTHTMIELAEIVRKLTSSESEIIYKELPSDDPTNRKPDLGRIEQLISWKPQVSLEEGIRRTIDYFQSIDVN